MKRLSITLLSLILILVFLAGCGRKKSEAKNIEQIQREEGIPVRITEIQPSVYTETLKYNAVLSGIEEASVSAMVGDIVTAINVKVGDHVNKDQVILTFPIDTPGAQYQQANVAYLNSKATYERMQRLFAQGAISQQDMDNVETGFKVSQANFNTAKDMIYVKAPISGYVTNLLVNVGDKVDSGNALFTVSNTSKYKAVIWVPDTEIQKIRKGQKAEARWNEEVLSGHISSVAMAMDQNQKAFRAEVVFDTKTKYMASGVTVEVSINTITIPNAVVIERKTISETEGKYYIWVVEQNKAVKRAIQLGQNNGIRYVVTEGLNPGDKLITEGTTMVYEGSLVKVIQ